MITAQEIPDGILWPIFCGQKSPSYEQDLAWKVHIWRVRIFLFVNSSTIKYETMQKQKKTRQREMLSNVIQKKK